MRKKRKTLVNLRGGPHRLITGHGRMRSLMGYCIMTMKWLILLPCSHSREFSSERVHGTWTKREGTNVCLRVVPHCFLHARCAYLGCLLFSAGILAFRSTFVGCANCLNLVTALGWSLFAFCVRNLLADFLHCLCLRSISPLSLSAFVLFVCAVCVHICGLYLLVAGVWESCG